MLGKRRENKGKDTYPLSALRRHDGSNCFDHAVNGLNMFVNMSLDGGMLGFEFVNMVVRRWGEITWAQFETILKKEKPEEKKTRRRRVEDVVWSGSKSQFLLQPGAESVHGSFHFDYSLKVLHGSVVGNKMS